MEYLWIFVAFVSGYLVKQINLPPLIGYLAAGFGLHAMGVEFDQTLEELGNFGVTLLLFTIGLKLDIKNLFKVVVFGSAIGHMGSVVLITVLNTTILAALGISYFAGMDFQAAAVIGFAVSFSSTVCVVKILEENGEMSASHGKMAIGILVIQDIAAVLFISMVAGKPPSWYALALLGLPLMKPLLNGLLKRCGHGEVLPLAGIFLAFSGGWLFESLGLKSELGALVVAALISDHPKASELSKSLLNLKDLFLICFFLSIGFVALPTFDMLGVALLMLIALPVKAGMLFVWLTQLGMRSRTAFLSSLSLANYSEFGLIVCSAGVAQGLLEKEWLVIMALGVSLSFIFSSFINTKSHRLYSRFKVHLKRFEKARPPSKKDVYSQPGSASILVVGMGRVGTGAYDTLQDDLKKDVCGIDVDKKRVVAHCRLGRHVILADAEDPDFWSHTSLDKVELIMFAMPKVPDILEANKQLKNKDYQGRTSAVAKYEDEKESLLEAGVDEVFNFYAEAGVGFADQSMHLLKSQG